MKKVTLEIYYDNSPVGKKTSKRLSMSEILKMFKKLNVWSWQIVISIQIVNTGSRTGCISVSLWEYMEW